jgi:hypothetical protein
VLIIDADADHRLLMLMLIVDEDVDHWCCSLMYYARTDYPCIVVASVPRVLCFTHAPLCC